MGIMEHISTCRPVQGISGHSQRCKDAEQVLLNLVFPGEAKQHFHLCATSMQSDNILVMS